MPLIRKTSGEGTVPPQNPDLGAMLDSTSPDERWAAVRRLAASPANTTRLGERLAHEQDKRVREAIFTALAQIGTEEAAGIVAPHLRDEDAAVRTEAIDALCAMPNAALPHLPALLSDTDSDIRLLVCEIVRRLPAPTATELLCRLLDNETQANVCAAAVEVLTEVGEPSALPVLAKCATRFSEVPFLAFAIQIAATRIDSGVRGANAA
jgi:HEAT repeat protein